MLTIQRLKELLHYDPDTGIFTNLKGRMWTVEGERAGGLDISSGYRYIDIDGERYLEHRLAWLYCFEEWPDSLLDHKNRIRADNTLDNLREATTTQNSYNFISESSTTGYRGVSESKKNFRAAIEIKGTTIHLGTFSTPEEASIVYEKEAKDLQGEFYADPGYLYNKNIVPKPLVPRVNSLGFPGVTVKKNKFMARVSINGVRINLGSFCTPELAYEAILKKKKEIGKI